VKIPEDKKPVVSLSITDDQGIPLPQKALEGYGFTLAQIEQDRTTGLTKYQNLLVKDVQGKPYKEGGETKQPALQKASQPYADSGGAWSAAEDGSYTYVFTNTLTLPAEPNLTTVLGVYAYKDGRATVANTEFTFVPDGSAPQVSREVVSTADCNTCHNPLQAHGGMRRDTGLCVTCHTDQNIDPETGNTLDFKVLIHRLHSGASLPSVQNGTPYQIVGHNQEVSDFSDVTWPQDVRNCTTCHSKGAQAANYKVAPNAAACTSCHDNVNVVTGENHPGGKQTDGKCAGCHQPEGQEFDASITGAHTIPLNSANVKGVKLEIVKVEGATPGGKPVVTFKVTDNSGQTIAPAEMDYLALTYAGPTSDYTNRVTETIFRKPTDGSTPPPPKVEDIGDGAYRYTFQAALPADAAGSYGFGMEGYVMETIPNVENPLRVAGYNPVVYVSLEGGDPAPRREVVDREKCNACHKNLALHGTIRQNTEYCVLCHNTTGTDEEERPADAMPPASINFRVLIHRIHRGEEATNPAVIYGHGGSANNFGDIVFPGDLADCETCHLPGTYGLPLAAGIQPTTISQADKVIASILPVASVCTACHDSSAVQGHVALGTTAAGQETCEVCHGVGKEFDVTKVHH
jgi:OmcA/MtrC family decaheme c-type cytochrome